MMSASTRDWKTRLRTLLRSWVVGGLATITHLCGLIVLVDLFDVHERLANPPALIVALTIHFFGNKYFAFEDHSPRLLHQGSLFLLVEFGAFLLNLLVYDLLISHWHTNYILAMLITTFVVYQGFSYPLWGYIFRKSVDAPAPEAAGDKLPVPASAPFRGGLEPGPSQPRLPEDAMAARAEPSGKNALSSDRQ